MASTFHCSNGPSKDSKTCPVHSFNGKKVHKQVKKVVLVMVDDDEDDCFLVEAALREACFNCTFRCVHDGLEMIDYLSRSGRYQDSEAAPMPDIILLDLNMPRMNGRQVLEQLKADCRFRAIPVIILTTSRDDQDVKACYALGANSYITKEASFDGILSIIKSIHEYWLEVATLPPRIHP